RQVSNWPVPDFETKGSQLFVSESGQRAIICWTSGNRVVYRESTQSGWTGQLEIGLSESLDTSRAYQLLEQRVRNH
ncbi:MAG TPA: hypothetical protein VH394_03775, partial [Thermoanaerobaculia bacterium]|nr:hypothetical protein [Thermoanaerobaculia bacterium]